MKKIILLLVAAVGFVGLQSCEGPEGRPGYDGLDGLDGGAVAVYEIEANLNSPNNFEATVTFVPPLADADLVLVYRLDGVDNKTDVWRMLPQTYYLGQYEIDYNFDYTKRDFRVFIDSNMDNPDLLDNGYWTHNQVFRAVVLEGYFGNVAKSASEVSVQTNLDYETVAKRYNIKESDIKRIKK